MTDITFFPAKFKEFERKKNRIVNAEAKMLLNRFAYRYRLAKSFTGIVAPEVGRTLLGYDAIMKVFLAYTAFENVYEAAKKLRIYGQDVQQKRGHKDLPLAARVRQNAKLKDFLPKYHHEEELKGILDLFFRGRINDIVCICFALRNIFAHGDLTPSAIGINNKKERQLLFDLADALLSYSDTMFTDCMPA